MAKPRYHNHICPDHQRWGRTYPKFPGLEECVRLILSGKATGAWADLVAYELAEHADQNMPQMIALFYEHQQDRVSTYMMMAFDTAALPASVDFLESVLQSGDERFTPYARSGLVTIDTKESRTALFRADHGGWP